MSEEPVLRIEFDQVTGFQFQAAYKAYSDLYDESTDVSTRKYLNDCITKLHKDEISNKEFYEKINQCRESAGKYYRFHRMRIRGKRKRAYRRDQQERDRMRRHKR